MLKVFNAADGPTARTTRAMLKDPYRELKDAVEDLGRGGVDWWQLPLRTPKSCRGCLWASPRPPRLADPLGPRGTEE